ncbi:MAG TPA: enoyl-CoA hydratase-related protein [Acidimicrobiales bacterium]
MSDDDLVTEQRGNVVVLRLNRPESRNSLTRAMIGGIGQAIIDAENDPDTRVVVLTGTGDKAFCSGMDLREFAEGGPPDEGTMEGTRAFQRLGSGQAKIPIVGAINATAVAGGFELMLACDVSVVSDRALFGIPEVKRGLFAGGGGTTLGSRIPLAIALELGLTGEYIDAERAYDLGLVNRVVPPEQVMDSALELAGRIAANGPLGLTATKELLWLSALDPTAVPERQMDWQQIVMHSEDAKEGSLAFVEKRAPVWKGR